MAEAVGWDPADALAQAGAQPLNVAETAWSSDDPRKALHQCLNVLSDMQVRALLHVARTMADPHAAVPRHAHPRPGSVTIDRIPRGDPVTEHNNHNSRDGDSGETS